MMNEEKIEQAVEHATGQVEENYSETTVIRQAIVLVEVIDPEENTQALCFGASDGLTITDVLGLVRGGVVTIEEMMRMRVALPGPKGLD